MSRCVDLDERVTAQFYDQECEEWTMQTVTIEDVLDSVCDEYTVLPSAQPEQECEKCIFKPFKQFQPERKKGKWLEREVTHIDDLEAKDIISAWQSCKCSVCGRYDTKPYMYYFNAPKYCGWCGAEMEVSE